MISEPEGFKAISPGSSECNERTPGVNGTYGIHPEGVAAPSDTRRLFPRLEDRIAVARAATPFGVFRYGGDFPGYRSVWARRADLAQPRANGFEPFGFSGARGTTPAHYKNASVSATP